MKKKYLKKKLLLNKETVSNLNSYEMKKIAGGVSIDTVIKIDNNPDITTTDIGNPVTTDGPSEACRKEFTTNEATGWSEDG